MSSAQSPSLNATPIRRARLWRYCNEGQGVLIHQSELCRSELRERSASDAMFFENEYLVKDCQLNHVAAFIWARCDGFTPIHVIVDELLCLYPAVNPAEIENDVLACVEMLDQSELLIGEWQLW